uniref:Uncharacterized protein n=1 Tax=Rhodosorus marinus TaxID=101924 RepID=A0A7S0BLQ1_9RHOD|mmetsp:Transcript_2180/g.3242  ORF Transcript_2180/g.3242 Transcript_2180/m.3242 type:complete len:201 (+) Transcript_2180:151-753(+)
MKYVAWCCCALVFLCVLSVGAQTCFDAFGPSFLAITGGSKVVQKISVDVLGSSVGQVTLEPVPEPKGGDAICFRMRFTTRSGFGLTSIRGGIFSKAELIPEPAEYPNRRNVAKVVKKRGLPPGTILTSLSLVICQDEIVADPTGCCDGSPLSWIAHAIVTQENVGKVRAEMLPDASCLTRVGDGPDISVCEVSVECTKLK